MCVGVFVYITSLLKWEVEKETKKKNHTRLVVPSHVKFCVFIWECIYILTLEQGFRPVYRA